MSACCLKNFWLLIIYCANCRPRYHLRQDNIHMPTKWRHILRFVNITAETKARWSKIEVNGGRDKEGEKQKTLHRSWETIIMRNKGDHTLVGQMKRVLFYQKLPKWHTSWRKVILPSYLRNMVVWCCVSAKTTCMYPISGLYIPSLVSSLRTELYNNDAFFTQNLLSEGLAKNFPESLKSSWVDLPSQ